MEKWYRNWRWGVIGGLAVIFVFILMWVVPSVPGVDFAFSFYPVVEAYLTGVTQLYDANNFGVYHPPWVIWSLIPFGLMPYQFAEALLRTLTVIFIVAAVLAYTRDRREFLLGVTFALFNLHTFDLLNRAQITGYNALGAVLLLVAYRRSLPYVMGVGYLMMTVSLPNAILFALVFMAFSYKKWDQGTFLKSLIIPFVGLVASFLIDGIWPLRWLNNMRVRTPGEDDGTIWFTTIWRIANVLDIPYVVPVIVTLIVGVITVLVWRRVVEDADHDPDRLVLPGAMLWTCAIFLVTPWALSYRYLLIYAVVTPWLLRWRLEPVIVLHLFTFLPIARLYIGVGNSWVDILYPVAAWIIVIIYLLREDKPHGIIPIHTP